MKRQEPGATQHVGVGQSFGRFCALASVTVLGSAVLLSGCSSDSVNATSDDSASAASGGVLKDEGATDLEAADDQLTADGSAASSTAGGQREQSVAAPIPAVEREVIATAEVTLRVDDVAAAVPKLTRAATSAGGYVAGEDTSTDPDDPNKTRSTLILRVPTDQLQAVLTEVQGAGAVVRTTSDTRDVTEEVVDVDSRVDSARASVARIRALLSGASTLGDVVRIESELARRESDLESLLARQRTLADQTALATLTVSVLGPEAVAAAPDPEEEKGFVAGFSKGWDAFVGAVVVGLTVVGVLLPFALAGLLLLLPVWWIWRWRGVRFTTVHQPPPS